MWYMKVFLCDVFLRCMCDIQGLYGVWCWFGVAGGDFFRVVGLNVDLLSPSVKGMYAFSDEMKHYIAFIS